MVAFEIVVQKFFSKRIVDILLMGVVLVFYIMGPERIVEGEIFLLYDLSTLCPCICDVCGIGYEQLRSLAV